VVSVISTGIAFHDHGDHGDIDVDDPELLDTTLEGSRPAHFVERQGNVAQWFDGEDKARFFTEKATLEGKPQVREIGVGAAHHGVAVPFDKHAVVTIPNPEDASKRPIGARLVDLDGKQIGEDVACPGLHGSAGSGSLYALACDTGLLLISQDGDVPEIRHLPYSDNLPEGSSSPATTVPTASCWSIRRSRTPSAWCSFPRAGCISPSTRSVRNSSMSSPRTDSFIRWTC
jgi:hypothetical protein